MPLDRLYHRGHTWVKKSHDGTLAIGIDDFAKRIIGKADTVVLPKIGSELEVNGTGWFVEKNGIKIRILSPVEGKVIELGNGEMANRRSGETENVPQRDPFGRGIGESENRRDGDDFYIRVKPKDGIDLRHLLKGAEIRAWIMREMERLETMLSSENVGISLADGGEMVNDLTKNYPEVDWDNVLGEMFLEP